MRYSDGDVVAGLHKPSNVGVALVRHRHPGPMTNPFANADVTRRLELAGCVAAADEAAELVSAATDDATLEAWVRRRETGEPLAWITGTTLFCGRALSVDHGVYVPRPQTEELARRAAAVLPPGGRAADLCTGVGAIAAHLMARRLGAVVIGVDRDPAAVRCARRNGVGAVVGDLAAPLSSGAFDVVTAVAPYVPTEAIALLPADVRRYEPLLALDGGPDGLAVVRRVVAGAARLLRPGGYLLVELGADQDALLAPVLGRRGFSEPAPWHDAEGDLRGVATRLVRPVEGP
jgi:release factor glutamine methyltransferase